MATGSVGFFQRMALTVFVVVCVSVQVLMLVAWVVKIVKSCCINSTSSLVNAQPARGKRLSGNLIQSFSVLSLGFYLDIGLLIQLMVEV